MATWIGRDDEGGPERSDHSFNHRTGGARIHPGRAALYSRYRRGYPSELIRRLRRFGGDGEGRLLDLGCGTGQLLLQLASSFEQTVGVDPEPDMLQEAERAARERKITNAQWLEGSSRDLEQLRPALGWFDLVTIGTAFHFMESRATLAALQEISAAVAIAYVGSPMWLHPDPWAQALRGVLEARLGPLEDHDFTVEAFAIAEATMRDLGYHDIERWEQRYEETIDIDFVVGHILSATSTEQIPLSQKREFANEVRSAITAASPSAPIREAVPVRAIIASTGHARAKGKMIAWHRRRPADARDLPGLNTALAEMPVVEGEHCETGLVEPLGERMSRALGPPIGHRWKCRTFRTLHRRGSRSAVVALIRS
jgi:SAM-dependent methyltransferase